MRAGRNLPPPPQPVVDDKIRFNRMGDVGKRTIKSKCLTRIYFVGGAGLDTIGWRYTQRWANSFKRVGAERFVAIMDVSHDFPGSVPINDILFTSEFRCSDRERVPISFDLRGLPTKWEERIKRDSMIDKAVREILTDLLVYPLTIYDRLVLIGYSYGSVIQAHVTLKLSQMGHKVSSLVLVGSPIPSGSYLFQRIKMVANVIRKDIPGDMLSNPSNAFQFFEGAKQNSDDSGPHFDMARPGIKTDQRIEKTVREIENEIEK